MNWWVPPLALACTPLVYVAARTLYDDVYRRVRVAQRDRIKLQSAALDALRHFPPDERGRLGTVMRPSLSLVNLDTRTTLDEQWAVTHIDPLAEKMDALQRLLLAGSPSHQPQPDAQWGSMLESGAPQLPSQISIEDALGMRTPSLDALVLGVTLDESGQVVPIVRSLNQLMHLLAIGITGSGKSTWLLSFLAQIEMCKQAIEVVLIDVHGSAFNLCAKWSKLRYPIARNNEEAKAVLNVVYEESQRRAVLYESLPLAEDLPSYNSLAEKAGCEKLTPWIIVIDEGTLMLSDSSVSGPVALSVQGTRQYGIYVFMTGQTGNATVIKSPIRSNFPTRVCYTTEKHSTIAALGEAPPEELPEIPGRGWARLKGRKTPIMFQAPYIRRVKFFNMIEHEGPKNAMPQGEEEEQEWTGEYLRKLWDSLPSKGKKSAMCVALGGKPEGHHWGRVEEACKAAGLPWKKEQ